MPLPSLFRQEKLALEASPWPEGAYKYSGTGCCDFCGATNTYEYISPEISLSQAHSILRNVLIEVFGYRHPISERVENLAAIAAPHLSKGEVRRLFKHLIGKRAVACKSCSVEVGKYVAAYFSVLRRTPGNVISAAK